MTTKKNTPTVAFSKLDLTSQLIASLVNDLSNIAGDIPDKEWKKKWLKQRLVEAIWAIYGEHRDFRSALAEDLKEELHACFIQASKDENADQILLQAFVMKVDFWFKNLHKEAV